MSITTLGGRRWHGNTNPQRSSLLFAWLWPRRPPKLKTRSMVFKMRRSRVISRMIAQIAPRSTKYGYMLDPAAMGLLFPSERSFCAPGWIGQRWNTPSRGVGCRETIWFNNGTWASQRPQGCCGSKRDCELPESDYGQQRGAKTIIFWGTEPADRERRVNGHVIMTAASYDGDRR